MQRRDFLKFSTAVGIAGALPRGVGRLPPSGQPCRFPRCWRRIPAACSSSGPSRARCSGDASRPIAGATTATCSAPLCVPVRGRRCESGSPTSWRRPPLCTGTGWRCPAPPMAARRPASRPAKSGRRRFASSSRRPPAGITPTPTDRPAIRWPWGWPGSSSSTRGEPAAAAAPALGCGRHPAGTAGQAPRWAGSGGLPAGCDERGGRLVRRSDADQRRRLSGPRCASRLAALAAAQRLQCPLLTLATSDYRPLYVIGSDGGLLAEPVALSELALLPGSASR